jgi:hypothetical protein
MNPANLPSRQFFAPDHGGETIKGGGPESLPTGSGGEEIMDALGQPVAGHQKMPGTGDPGVPGSRTNPVTPGEEVRPESDQPVGRPTGEGSGSGS